MRENDTSMLSNLVEDKTFDTMKYVDYMCFLHDQIKDILMEQ